MIKLASGILQTLLDVHMLNPTNVWFCSDICIKSKVVHNWDEIKTQHNIIHCINIYIYRFI